MSPNRLVKIYGSKRMGSKNWIQLTDLKRRVQIGGSKSIVKCSKNWNFTITEMSTEVNWTEVNWSVNIINTQMIKQGKCHKNWRRKKLKNWNITKTKMSPKLICHQNWNVTKSEISPKLNWYQNWSVIKTEILPKLKCYQTL